MPRGVHMRCAKPGHVERKTRPNGGTVCVACQRAHDQRRLLAARWATVMRRYEQAVKAIGVGELHARLRAEGFSVPASPLPAPSHGATP